MRTLDELIVPSLDGGKEEGVRGQGGGRLRGCRSGRDEFLGDSLGLRDGLLGSHGGCGRKMGMRWG